MESLLNEFSNYLLSNNSTDEGNKRIKGLLIDSPEFCKVNFVRYLRVEDESENKSVIEKDISDNEIISHKYSQVNELVNIFGLNNNNDVKNKLKEYLDQFLEHKKHL
jgi:hypothetical protein